MNADDNINFVILVQKHEASLEESNATEQNGAQLTETQRKVGLETVDNEHKGK